MNSSNAMHLKRNRTVSHSLFLFLLVPFIFLAAGEAKAEWVAIGPDGGGTNTSAAIANWPGAETIFVGNESGGLSRSTDGGETYSLSNGSMKVNSTINAIAVDQNNPGVVYVATNIGVYKSTDSGSTWNLLFRAESKSTRSELAGGNRLVIDPNDSDSIYLAAKIDGLFKSTDAGQTWKSIQSGLPDKPVSIAVGSNGLIYAAVHGYGIYRSSTDGNSWQLKNSNLPESDIVTIKASPSNLDILYAVSDKGGAFKTTDSGESWLAKNNGIDFSGEYDRYRALAIDHSDPEVAYLSAWHYSKVFKTTDGGEDWEKYSSFNQEDAQSKGWSHRDLAVGAINPDLLVLATGNATFRSTDGGMSWDRKQSGIKNGIIEVVQYDENSSAIWIGNYDHGLAKSIDEGRNWSFEQKGFTRGLLIDSNTSPSTMFWSLDSELRKSGDGGVNWNSITSYPGGGDVHYCDSSRETMYATAGNGKVYKSIDTGETWSLTEAMPANGEYEVRAIAVDPVSRDTVYAGTDSPDGGVYRSDDAGYTWTKLMDSPNWKTTSIAIDPGNPSVILVGYEQWSRGNGQIFKSADRGSSFVQTYVENDMPVKKVYIDPSSPNQVYAVIGTSNPRRELSGTIISSNDGGDNWADISENLPVSGLEDVIKHPTENSILAGARGGSLWKRGPLSSSSEDLVAEFVTDTDGGNQAEISSGAGNPPGLSDLVFDKPGDYVLTPEDIGDSDLTMAVTTGASPVDNVRMIARLYSAAFDREPKIDGLNFWVRSFESGKSITQIAKDFYQSPEFTDKYGALFDVSYVEQLFKNVLGREGEQSGIDFWVGKIARGASRAKVLEKFADSPENISKTDELFGSMRLEEGLWTM